MKLDGKKVVVIGGAGLIGSHLVDELLKTQVAEVLIYDNFVRGVQLENLSHSLSDSRVKVFEQGGDILQNDILEVALTNADGVFSFGCFVAFAVSRVPTKRF